MRRARNVKPEMSRRLRCAGLLCVEIVLSLSGIPVLAEQASRSSQDSLEKLPPSAIARCGDLRMRPGRATDWPFMPVVAAVSPSGDRIATGAPRTGTISLWNTTSRHRIRTWEAYSAPIDVVNVAFSAAGTRIATTASVHLVTHPVAEKADRLRVWLAASGDEQYSLPAGVDSELLPVFSPDDRWLAFEGPSGSLDIARSGDGRVVHQLTVPDGIEVDSICFSGDSRSVAAVGLDAFRIWDVGSGKTRSTWNLRSPKRWVFKDVTTGEIAQKSDFSKKVYHLALSPTFGRVAICYADHVAIVERQTRKERQRVKRDHAVVSNVTFTPDEKHIAFEARQHANAIQFVDVETGKTDGVFRGHRVPARRISFSADGSRLLAKTEFRLYVWDVKTRKLLPYLDGHEIVSRVAFSPDGRFVASEGLAQVEDEGIAEPLPMPESGDGVRVWDAATGRQRFDFGPRRGLLFTPDSKQMLTWRTDGGIHVHDLATGKTVDTFGLKKWEGQPAKTIDPTLLSIQGVQMAADGQLLAYRIDDSQLALFDRHTKAYRFLPRPDIKKSLSDGFWTSPPQLSRDGKTYLCAIRTGRLTRGFAGGTYHLVLFDASHGKRLMDYEPENRTIDAIALSLDARLSAAWCTPDFDHEGPSEIHLVDVDSGHLQRKIVPQVDRPLTGLTRWPDPLAFSPDGKLLATAGPEGTARVWDIETGRLRHELRGHVGEVTSVAFSADGKKLATGSIDSTVLVWDLESLVNGNPEE